MARVYEFEGKVPVVAPGAYVHPDAVLVGEVVIEAGAYLAPLCSLRGDFGRIVIGEGANVQDTCVVHCFPGQSALVGRNGHVGHGSVLHGCRVGDDALIGMNSVLMDGSVVGEGAFVAANSFLKAEFVVPARHLAVGTPAEVKRPLSKAEIEWKANGTMTYQLLARRCRAGLRRVEPLLAEPTESAVRGGGDPTDHVTLHEYRSSRAEHR